MEIDYYEILGVEPDAEIEVIKRRYRVLVRENHPDVSPNKDVAHDRMQLILTAWNILSDPSQRARYDLSRREKIGRSKPASTNPTPPPPASTGPNPFYTQRNTVDPVEEARKRARANQVMRGNAPPPRGNSARTRLLSMVLEAHKLYREEGRIEDAIRVCTQVMKADPTNAEAVGLLGDLYAEQNRKDMALAMYERAMRLQPNNLLYRQKWDQLRHGAPSQDKPDADRSSGVNPWAKAPNRKSLSERLAESGVTESSFVDKSNDPLISSLRREASTEDPPSTNDAEAPNATTPVAEPTATENGSGTPFLKIKLPWRR
jgi:curved DNA-binding protein CbpA